MSIRTKIPVQVPTSERNPDKEDEYTITYNYGETVQGLFFSLKHGWDSPEPVQFWEEWQEVTVLSDEEIQKMKDKAWNEALELAAESVTLKNHMNKNSGGHEYIAAQSIDKESILRLRK